LRVIIIGAGEVGSSIAAMLSRENNDVIVIEKSEEIVKNVMNSSLDAQIIRSDGLSPTVLEEAGIKDTRMLIAVTNVDETNIVACLLAKEYNVPLKIARIRSPELSSKDFFIPHETLGIDFVINPDQIIAEEIKSLIKMPGATNLFDFADGLVKLIGIKVDQDSSVVNKSLKELRDLSPGTSFVVVSVLRHDKLIIPKGDDTIIAEDQLFIIAKSDSTDTIMSLFGKNQNNSKNGKKVMIIGGGRIGRSIALELEKEHLSITLIEKDKDKCQLLASQSDKILVLNGDGTDENLLLEEGIKDTAVFIATTNDEETNLLTSLLAKHHKVSKTIALINKKEYFPLLPSVGIDVPISPRQYTANAILKYVRRGRILSMATISETDAETLEMIAPPFSKIINTPLKKLKLPSGAIIGAIVHGQEVFIPIGDDIIQPDDRVIIFAIPSAIPSLEKLFEG
jgi:trk system potassium uptake protein